MGFLVGRDGNISVIRLGALLASLGLVVIVAGLIIFSFEQSSYQSPLAVEPFPGAQPWGEENISGTARKLQYQIPGKTPEEVRDYYQQKITEHYGSDTQNPNITCQRIPRDGNFPDYREGSTTVVPYFYTCMFERAGFRTLQFTRVVIQPGLFNEDPEKNTQGMTVVEYEQQWER